MRNWRVLTAVAAVVLAAVASVLAYTYLTQADARAQDKTELVPALVARSVIPKGTPGKSAVDEGLFTTKRVPREAVPDSVLTSDRGLNGLVASSIIAKGQFVVRDSFVAPSQVNGFSTAVKDGKQAISFSVDMAHGVAGFVQPNDSINVIYSLDANDKLAGSDSLKTTAFLIPGLHVVAVGNTTASTPTQTDAKTTDTTAAPAQQNVGLITVEATPRQAEQIAHAMNAGGTITISLNPPDFNVKDFKTPQEIVEAYNLFDQDLTFLHQMQAQLEAASKSGK